MSSADEDEDPGEADLPGQSTRKHLTDLQAEDDAESVEAAIDGLIQNQRERRRREEDLGTEAYVRELQVAARRRIAEKEEYDAGLLLGEMRDVIERDSDLGTYIEGRPDELAEALDIPLEKASSLKATWRRHGKIRDRGRRFPDPEHELKVLSAFAKALGYMSSVSDPTRYAPVRFEAIDEPGAKTQVDEPTPVGRIRISRSSDVSIEDKTVEIPHKSCDHVLAIALPRRGKDSTLASFGKNLKEEHQYSYFSIYDDGRMETPMMAVANDDRGIQKNLERLGQEPDAMDIEVFVPRMTGLPEKLPANFTPFTISIADFTPSIILRLAGITKADMDAEARVKRALEETLANDGDVSQLVMRLQIYANETDAVIEWTEVEERPSGGDVETYQAEYAMREDEALRKAAAQLARLAGEGLIASPSASTNIDMEAVIREQETAAVLCCNFLQSSREALKYTIIDLWLRLIYEARDSNPRLPRVCLEIRELKNLAPSKWGDASYKDAIKPLRQTLFFLSSQGGSRRIMMLASTQKINDVYKPIRSNMATKIMLQLNDEGIETLDRSIHFSYEQKDQLAGFDIGMGMIYAEGDAHWPIEWRGAPCGLGLGDYHWLDRYGEAMGARVRTSHRIGWKAGTKPDWWVHVPDASVVDADDRAPRVGDYYSEWYLLPTDFPDETTPEDVDEPLVREALAERRDYPLKSDLMLLPSDVRARQTTMVMNAKDNETAKEEVIKECSIPHPVQDWLDKQRKTRKKLVEAVLGIAESDEDSIRTQQAWADELSYSRSTLANYTGDGEALDPCIEKTEDGYYALTPTGQAVARVDWETVEANLYD